MTTPYKINEIFETLQGEGFYTGQPSIFIRLQGCPVGCSWCDTKHTWETSPEMQIIPSIMIDKKVDTDEWSLMDTSQLLVLFKEQGYRAKHVVITGGEPCMEDLTPLCESLEIAGYSCQIETSGTFEVRTTTRCWVTVSPKINMRGGFKILSSALHRANEIKHPVATEQHIDDLKALLKEHNLNTTPIYLQPISQKQRATELAIEACIENNWRLSVQVHKYLGIE